MKKKYYIGNGKGHAELGWIFEARNDLGNEVELGDPLSNIFVYSLFKKNDVQEISEEDFTFLLDLNSQTEGWGYEEEKFFHEKLRDLRLIE